MKKTSISILLAAAFMLSSCTSMESGLYGGSIFGSILGSAIGGLSDGPRGSDVGTIVGMVGGAVVGAAIGNASEKSREQRIQERRERIASRNEAISDDNGYYNYGQAGLDHSGFDPSGNGDDRIADFDADESDSRYKPVPGRVVGSGADAVPSAGALNGLVEIRHARLIDTTHDNILSSNEVCHIVFEVVNTSDRMLRDITPMVYERSGNRRIYISEPIHVERLAPGKGIRYTATIKSGKMKTGEACFVLNVMQGNKRMAWAQEITVRTQR